MEGKYDLGTPIGGERKMRRVHSPLHEMDGIVGALVFEDEGVEASVPATPKEDEPVTMAAIAQLLNSALDQKLTAVTQKMERVQSELKKDVTDLKEEVHTIKSAGAAAFEPL